jgi:hypothetical protein
MDIISDHFDQMNLPRNRLMQDEDTFHTLNNIRFIRFILKLSKISHDFANIHFISEKRKILKIITRERSIKIESGLR